MDTVIRGKKRAETKMQDCLLLVPGYGNVDMWSEVRRESYRQGIYGDSGSESPLDSQSLSQGLLSLLTYLELLVASSA